MTVPLPRFHNDEKAAIALELKNCMIEKISLRKELERLVSGGLSAVGPERDRFLRSEHLPFGQQPSASPAPHPGGNASLLARSLDTSTAAPLNASSAGLSAPSNVASMNPAGALEDPLGLAFRGEFSLADPSNGFAAAWVSRHFSQGDEGAARLLLSTFAAVCRQRDDLEVRVEELSGELARARSEQAWEEDRVSLVSARDALSVEVVMLVRKHEAEAAELRGKLAEAEARAEAGEKDVATLSEMNGELEKELRHLGDLVRSGVVPKVTPKPEGGSNDAGGQARDAAAGEHGTGSHPGGSAPPRRMLRTRSQEHNELGGSLWAEPRGSPKASSPDPEDSLAATLGNASRLSRSGVLLSPSQHPNAVSRLDRTAASRRVPVDVQAQLQLLREDLTHALETRRAAERELITQRTKWQAELKAWQGRAADLEKEREKERRLHARERDATLAEFEKRAASIMAAVARIQRHPGLQQ